MAVHQVSAKTVPFSAGHGRENTIKGLWMEARLPASTIIPEAGIMARAKPRHYTCVSSSKFLKPETVSGVLT
ncbi:hypothetical protein DUI87_11205 [Hirundo rustica rustica]|uniref:Uncharacterized protein n=1 Tax=Hirundo rustica rustica TaxID=333673 RepID=A0A3M0KM81_HIRRU|nr:hypothetical protein DUI87_11205 [Hirundo rustica rustica]